MRFHDATRSTVFLALALLLLTPGYAFTQQGQPSEERAAAAKRNIRETDLFDFVWIADPQVSPDGSQVVFSRVVPNQERSGYIGAIWMAATRGDTAPIELITGKNVGNARWSPDGQSLIYRRDGQLALFSLRSKESRTLTSLPGGAGSPVWSPDGRRVVFLSSTPDREPTSGASANAATNHKSDVHVITDASYHTSGRAYLDPTNHQHLWVLNVPNGADETAKPTQLTTGTLDDNEPVWSPDGSRIYFVTAPVEEQFTKKTLYSVSADGGQPLKLATIPIGIFHLAVSPDGKRLAFHGAVVTEPIRSYSQFDLWVMDLKANATPRNLTANYDFDMNNSITGDNNASLRTGQTLHWSPDGRWIFDLTSKWGRTALARVDAQSGAVQEITTGDQAVLDFTLTPDARTFVTVVSNPVMMADLFVTSANGTQRRLTDVNEELWSQLTMTLPEEITYRSFDGRQIQGWIQKPPDFDPRKKYPLILQIHAGPHGAWGWTFNHEFQLMAARGYVVLYVNPRGSFGYGQEFGNIIQYHFPGDDARDLMIGVDKILKRGYTDPKKLGVAGGSAGGALVDWIVGHTDRFAAAASSRDIANWETWWYTTSFPFFQPQWFKSPPFRDPASYAARSPITYVEKIHTPIMFIEGEDDHNAPSYAGGEQLFRSLKYLKRPAVMIIFPRENHGLHAAGEPWHRVERLQHILAWFDEWMMGVPHPEYGISGNGALAGK
jgi:dipeptidyl aminopeptidase/acylaminoacyl peptidase